MTDNGILELGEQIKKAARFVSYQWPGVLEADDAEQAINLHLLERPGYLQKILLISPDEQYRAIVWIGNQLASTERADFDYFKGSFRYAVDEVKDVLNRGVLTEPVEGFDAAVIDLIEGLVVLTKKSPQYVDALLDRYANWEVPAPGADQVRLSRALTAITGQMNMANKRRFNNRDDGPGTRNSISAESARALTDNDWENDAPVNPAHLRDS